MVLPTPEVNHIQENNDLQKEVLSAHLCVPPPTSNEGIFSRGQSVTVSRSPRLDPLKHHPSILPARPPHPSLPRPPFLPRGQLTQFFVAFRLKFFSKKSAQKKVRHHGVP